MVYMHLKPIRNAMFPESLVEYRCLFWGLGWRGAGRVVKIYPVSHNYDIPIYGFNIYIHPTSQKSKYPHYNKMSQYPKSHKRKNTSGLPMWLDLHKSC